MNLFISTATDKIYLAIFKDNVIIKELIHQGNNDHTCNLYKLLDELNCDYTNITTIYIVNGPGSYTGLRVGVIFIKTLGIEKNIPIVPINLLEALYHSNNKVPIGVDAKGQKYYTYDGNNHLLISTKELTGELLDPIININKLIKSNFLSTLQPIKAEELGVDYVKSAI